MPRALHVLASSLALLTAAVAGAAPIDPTSDTSVWDPIIYPSSTPDPTGDQGTGDREGDIVGDAQHAALYVLFDDAGTLSTTDGSLAFRVRLSGDSNPPQFGNFLALGLDAGEDALNDIDIFLGVDGQGSSDSIGLYEPGTGANTSPSTTTIAGTPSVSWSLVTGSSGNYDWSAVSLVTDPTATITDFGANGTDRFMTFVVPFADLVAQLALLGIAVDEDTAFRYVMGTGSQPNALNQDVGGTTALWSDPTSWDALGALSNPYSPAGGAVVPEPSPLALVLLGLAVLAGCGRRRRPL